MDQGNNPVNGPNADPINPVAGGQLAREPFPPAPMKKAPGQRRKAAERTKAW
jgi:hypothetical protein